VKLRQPVIAKPLRHGRAGDGAVSSLGIKGVDTGLQAWSQRGRNAVPAAKGTWNSVLLVRADSPPGCKRPPFLNCRY
jgi:hypothetical protein